MKNRMKILSFSAMVAVVISASVIDPSSSPVVALPRPVSQTVPVPGGDPFAMAVEQSQRLFPANGSETVYVTSAQTYSDAVISVPQAAAENAPLLLVASDHIPLIVAEELARQRPSRIVIVGGSDSVSEVVETALAAFAPAVGRIDDFGNQGMARAVSQSESGTSVPVVYVANRTGFPDGLLPAVPAVISGSPVILIEGSASSLDAHTRKLLSVLRPGSVQIVGGSSFVTLGIESDIRSIASTVTRVTGVEEPMDASVIDGVTSSRSAYSVAGTHSTVVVGDAIEAVSAGAPVMFVPGECVPAAVIDRLVGMAPEPVIPFTGGLTSPSSLAPLAACGTPPPPPPPIETSPAPSTPSSNRPGASNTGVPADMALRVHLGDLTITTPGAVINRLDIRGLVFVKAPNVTIRNSIIRGRVTSGDAALLSNTSPGLTVEDTEMYSADPSWKIKGFVGSNATFRRADIHDVTDQIHIIGDNVTVEDSWLHSNLHYANDPNNGGPTHDDSIQIQTGANMRFIRNYMEGAHNAAVQITQDRGVVTDVLLADNWLNTGSCTVNIAEKKWGPVRGVTITGNIFGRDTRYRNCGIITHPGTKPLLDVQRNFYLDNRAPVTINLF